MLRPTLPLALVLAFGPTAAGAAPSWTVLDSSRLGFVAYQQGQPVEGRFERFEASIAFAEDDLAGSRIEVTIDTTSATMGQSERDQAIHSSALLDVDTYPTASFVSEQIEGAAGRYEAQGVLTIRDVSREVVLPFTLEIDQGGSELRARAEGELAIQRLDYGVGQGDFASTTTVQNDVVIRVEIDATRPR